MAGGQHGAAAVPRRRLPACSRRSTSACRSARWSASTSSAGREGVLAIIATVAASDTFQFYTGRAFGRRPLAPTISPKKTIEGAIGGLVLAPLALVAIALCVAAAADAGGGVGRREWAS